MHATRRTTIVTTRLLRWLIPILVVISTSGCPRPRTTAVLCNNTGEKLEVVTSRGKVVAWKHAGTLEIGDDRALRWDDLDWMIPSQRFGRSTHPFLKVRKAEQWWRYRLDYVMPAASTDESGERNFYQMQADGLIYAAKAGSGCPASALATQGVGWPIRPRVTPSPPR